MKLNNFSERDQNKIVQLAMKNRDNVVEYQGKTVHLPDIINALFICVDNKCNNTLDITYYSSDIMNGGVAQRIPCIVCGGAMNRKYIGVNITQVLNKHMKHTDDYSKKEGLELWISQLDKE